MKIVTRDWGNGNTKTHSCIGNENSRFPFLTRASRMNTVYGNGIVTKDRGLVGISNKKSFLQAFNGGKPPVEYYEIDLWVTV